MPTPFSANISPASLEALEPRIAPAVIFVGSDPTSIGYDDAPFVKASASTDPAVEELFRGSNSHYYLNLSARDKVEFYDIADGYQDFISVGAGRALAFFFDANGDNTVQKNELSGFALAQGTKLTVIGTVNGDIVGNLDGRTQLLSPVVSVLGGGLTQDLLGVAVSRLAIDGDVNGRIISGGNLSNVSVKTIEQITTASNGTYVYDWSGGAPGGGGSALLAPFLPPSGKAGGNISGVTVAVLVDNPALGARGAIIAGVGGAGGTGGSIIGVTVVSDPDGFLIQAGDGGDGTRGGRGGDVRNLVVNSVPDASLSVDLIEVKAGQGGKALGAGKAGGAGGSLAGLSIGYNSVGQALVETPLGDVVKIEAGRGGSGDVGGAGGSIKTVKVALDVDDPAGPEFTAAAGDGGNGTRRDGNGGSIISLTARNFNLAGLNNDAIALVAGNGGAGGGGLGAGGVINQATVFASVVSLTAGNGSNGTAGGRGGGISNVTLDVLPNFDRIGILKIKAGDGGSGISGAGGVGGAIAGVKGKAVDLVGPLASSIQSGNGGTSAAGRGGAAGAISTVKIAETLTTALPATLDVIAGRGGDGGAGGGIGGTLKNLTFQGFATSVLMSAGDGGIATVRGSGGGGGGVSAAVVQVYGGGPAQPGKILAGDGGDAAGAGGRGGAGGRIASATLIYAGSVEIAGGQGGSNGVGANSSSAVGAGGGVSRVVIHALGGNATLLGGAAGTPVAAAGGGAAGGAVGNANVATAGDVLIQAGNGRAGGSGGAVSNLSWFGVSGGQADMGAAPAGSIIVSGGQGSAGPRAAGSGGAVTNVSGYASATLAASTIIQAGDGNGGLAGSRAGNGGSISRVTFFGGAGGIEIVAGQGGSLDPASATGRTGGTGGSVSGVSAVAGLNLKVLAAGGGGDALFSGGRGGGGGSVTAVNVEGDIGIRTGQKFGIDSMGGVFAGRGGSGDPASGLLNGRSGNVLNVTAAAISSIVAGRPSSATPFDFSMVNLLDRVFVRGLAAPTVQLDGSFDAASAPGANPPRVGFADANMVGAVAGNPQAPGANVFKIEVSGAPTPVAATELQMRAAAGGGYEYNNPLNPADWILFRPIDGFVAAQQITAKTNFRAEALLTLVNPRDPSTLAFLDYRNNFNVNS